MPRRRALSEAEIRRQVELRAGRRCEYCHAPQRVSGHRYHVEHIVPKAKGGSDGLANRALACATCNLAKLDKTSGADPLTKHQVALFNPRTQIWDEHFRWDTDHQSIIGKTAIGRATVATLDMNNEIHMEARQLWFATGWLP